MILRQRGQTLVFTLVFGIATAMIALVLFNSGMLANAKTRLQNATDAGTYSAAVLQARDHNFSALTNRAMVANQAAVAQIVSMKSFLEDASNTHERLNDPILTFEALLPVSKPMWEAGKAHPIESIANTFNQFAPGAVQGLDLLIRAFEAAQQAHHAATALDMMVVADEVVKRNDTNAAITKSEFTLGRTAFHVKAWNQFTSQHSTDTGSPDENRFADVVVSTNTTDQFTRFRPSTPLPKWSSEVLWCKAIVPFYVASHTMFTFVHAGGSMLSADKRSWVALDATIGGGFQTCTFWYPCWVGVCYTTETTPLIDGNFGLGDSGGALAGTGGYDSLNGYTNNPASSNLFGYATLLPPGFAKYNFGDPGPTLDSAGGLQNYYRDVANLATTPVNQSAEQNGAPAVTIEVERLGASVRTSSKVLKNSQQLALKDGMQGDTMRALSSAHTYFYRPNSNGAAFTADWQRADGKAETANLFSPYWQTRLVDRSVTDRAASWAAQ